MDIYDILAFTLVVSGFFGGGYILKRAFFFLMLDPFLSILDFAWSATLFYIAIYFFATLAGWLYIAPLTNGIYIRPALVVLVNLPVIITIARR